MNIESTSTSTPTASAETGADNLLRSVGMQSGDTCLLVLETDESLYDNNVGQIVDSRCRALGAVVTVVAEPLISHAAEFPPDVSALMRQVNHTIFLSRLGDYVRFVELPGSCSKTTSYAHSVELLGSPYACIPHELMSALQAKLEAELLQATSWRITCPLGTDLSGTFCWPSLAGGADDEILVKLFPVSTFKPIPCNTASGTVALSRWLMPGGAPKVENAWVSFNGTVKCHISEGHIQSFDGPAETVKQITRHYDRIASELAINRNRVHSWHLGVQPQTFFSQPIENDFERWCALSFGSPRYLHFHTCGDEPPGEVAWSLFDLSLIHI